MHVGCLQGTGRESPHTVENGDKRTKHAGLDPDSVLTAQEWLHVPQFPYVKHEENNSTDLIKGGEH